MLGGAKYDVKVEVPALQISKQITFGQYKKYLEAIEKDSSKAFYKTQLPDSNMHLPEVYKAYISGNKFDDFTVVGIRWETVMNYCKWLTLKENETSPKCYYRLALTSEWLSAYKHLQTLSKNHDFNKNFSDWLISTQDETSQTDWKTMFAFDLTYFHKPNEPLSLKRKQIIGNSYHFSRKNLADYHQYSYYASEGYAHVGFRIVCVNISDKPDDLAEDVFKFWGLKL